MSGFITKWFVKAQEKIDVSQPVIPSNLDDWDDFLEEPWIDSDKKSHSTVHSGSVEKKDVEPPIEPLEMHQPKEMHIASTAAHDDLESLEMKMSIETNHLHQENGWDEGILAELEKSLMNEKQVFSLSISESDSYIPPETESLKNRLDLMGDKDAFLDDRIPLDHFLEDTEKLEKVLKNSKDSVFRMNLWAYPQLVKPIPSIPQGFPLQRSSTPTSLKNAIRSVRHDLEQLFSKIEIVESSGRTIPEADLQFLEKGISKIHRQLTPMDDVDMTDYKLASMRLELQVMEVQAEKYGNLARLATDIVRNMRNGYHISKTAHKVAVNAADQLFYAYKAELMRFYSTPTTLKDAGIPNQIASVLIQNGCHHIGTLALMSHEQIQSIPSIGEAKWRSIVQFFKEKGLPALCLTIPPIHDAVAMDSRSVGKLNNHASYEWRVPVCYGNMIFNTKMDGWNSGITIEKPHVQDEIKK